MIIVDGKTISSIPRRFAVLNRFRPRLTSLKHKAYCRRHLGKTLRGQCGYVVLLKAYVSFVRCSYSTQPAEVSIAVENVISLVEQLIEQIEQVATKKREHVSSRIIAKVGRALTDAKRQLHGSKSLKDCRGDWIDFGLVFHALFQDY